MDVHAGDTEPAALAQAVLRPSLQGAATVRKYANWFPAELDLNELVVALSKQADTVISDDLTRAEAMLAVQAHTLDAIFNDLARRAINAELLSQFDTYLKLGLWAQAQCRSTWEAISAIKNPPMANYVGQANIAHNQQVNNETSTRTRENENAPDKLLEDSNHEPDQWLDGGTPTAAVSVRY